MTRGAQGQSGESGAMGVQTGGDETMEAVRVWNSPHSIDDSSRSQMCVCVCVMDVMHVIHLLVCGACVQVCVCLWRLKVRGVCVCVY